MRRGTRGLWQRRKKWQESGAVAVENSADIYKNKKTNQARMSMRSKGTPTRVPQRHLNSHVHFNPFKTSSGKERLTFEQTERQRKHSTHVIGHFSASEIKKAPEFRTTDMRVEYFL